MTNDQKKMKKYMTAIERKLNLPRQVKVRVMSDLQSSVAARREAGQTDAQIMADLGAPKAVAEELNAQMQEYAYTRSNWRWAALAGAAVAGVMLLFESVTGLMVWLLNLSVNNSDSIGIIGGADGPTAIFVTEVTTTGGIPEWIVWLLVLTMCAIGWWKLSHIKKS